MSSLDGRILIFYFEFISHFPFSLILLTPGGLKGQFHQRKLIILKND